MKVRPIAVDRKPGAAVGTREVKPAAGAGTVDMETNADREEARLGVTVSPVGTDMIRDTGITGK